MSITLGFLVVAAVHFGQEVLVPLVLAALLSFLLAPLVDRLERRPFARIPAVLLTNALAFAVIATLAYVVAGQLLDLGYKLPSHKDNMRPKIASLHMPSEGPLANLTRIFGELRDEAGKPDASAPAVGRSRLSLTTRTLEESGTRVSRYLLMQPSRIRGRCRCSPSRFFSWWNSSVTTRSSRASNSPPSAANSAATPPPYATAAIQKNKRRRLWNAAAVSIGENLSLE